jgi:Tfp pilus assembly protein PilX
MKSTKNKKRGSALVYALVIMSVTMIILISMIGYITSQLKYSAHQVEKEKSLQIAEAGIYWYRWYLAHEVAGKTAQQINDFWQGGSAYGVSSAYEKDYFDPEGGAIGRYSIEVEELPEHSTIVIVKSTGWTNSSPNLKRTVRVRFRRPSWSEFAILANDYTRFGAGTIVYGRIHSNRGIRFDGVAHNVISSSVANFDEPDHEGGVEFGVHTHVNEPPATGSLNDAQRPKEAPPNPVPERLDVFKAGRQFPVPETSFSGVTSDLSYMKTQSQNPATGLYFDDSGFGRHIILKSDGTMDVKTVTDYNKDTYDHCGRIAHLGTGTIISETSSTNYVIPNNGVVFVENNAWVEGIINNKRVTIVAANLIGGSQSDIYIGMNNIRYTNSDGKDVLGLIGQRNVEVLRLSQDYLTIDGALLAQGGRVGRKYYSCADYKSNQKCESSSYKCDNKLPDHRNTITINGSLATNQRYGFAYADGTGYTNRILNFDNNLIYFPPPYFPTGTQYAIDQWEEIK